MISNAEIIKDALSVGNFLQYKSMPYFYQYPKIGWIGLLLFPILIENWPLPTARKRWYKDKDRGENDSNNKINRSLLLQIEVTTKKMLQRRKCLWSCKWQLHHNVCSIPLEAKSTSDRIYSVKRKFIFYTRNQIIWYRYMISQIQVLEQVNIGSTDIFLVI